MAAISFGLRRQIGAGAAASRPLTAVRGRSRGFAGRRHTATIPEHSPPDPAGSGWIRDRRQRADNRAIRETDMERRPPLTPIGPNTRTVARTAATAGLWMLLLCTVASGPAAARTFFVSPHGRLRSQCTHRRPCRTLAQAFSHARSGDAIAVGR